MKTVAIIQARMGSSRLPGKVLMSLAGKPVLWHIIHRLRKCKTLDAIALATTMNPIDDPLIKFAKNEGIEAIRGSEDNVLERYYLAAKTMQADIIVRVTGDAPLVDPGFLDYLVSTLLEKKVDWVGGDPEIPCIHEGFSPFTFKALSKLFGEVCHDPVAREHVDAYFKLHPDFIPGTYIHPAPEYQFRGARMSVDTPADLCFLEEVYRRLQAPPGEADVRDVVTLLHREPDLLKYNTFVHQKKADEITCRILFYCGADNHPRIISVTRCVAVARILRDNYGFGVTFVTVSQLQGADAIRRAGFPIETMVFNEEEKSFDEIIARIFPDVIVFGSQCRLNQDYVKKIRERKIYIVSIDKLTKGGPYIDIAIQDGVNDEEIARQIKVALL